VKDAAPLTGRKAIVVFSNGPDNASSIPPEDVAELAQSGLKKYKLRTRNGYRPQPARFSSEVINPRPDTSQITPSGLPPSNGNAQEPR
jgi:hypothetical protein